MRILVGDVLPKEGLELLAADGEFEVVNDPEITPERLVKEIAGFDALVIRSRSRATAEVIANADRLKVIGRAGVGLDNVDVEAATERGIIVMNTPEGNTLSTAEHTISMMLALTRHIPRADSTMKSGQWAKKSIQGSELYGKTLGIIGLGKIGGEVAARMRAFGMRILGHDPFVNKEAAEKAGIELCDVDEICRQADIVTVHTPLTRQTRGVINAERIAMMKPTTVVVNCARGGIVDEDALVNALREGRIAGAAMDVFVTEPLPEDHPLRGLDNVVLSPHLAASTAEAQAKVARDVARQIVDVLKGGVVRNAVNALSLSAGEMERIKPVLDLVERLGRFTCQFCPAPIRRLEILYAGSATEYPLGPLTSGLLKGYFEPHANVSVNYVNSMVLAKTRGIEVVESKSTETYNFRGLITIKAAGAEGEVNSISGSLFHGHDPRLVMINDMRFDVRPENQMIVIENRDVPGMVGKIGTLLGDAGINIADMGLGRNREQGRAITVINIDDAVPDAVVEKLKADPDILSVHRITI